MDHEAQLLTPSTKVIDDAAENPRDPISRTKAFFRVLFPISLMRDRKLRGPFTQAQFREAAEAARQQGSAGGIHEKAAGLWRIERIAFSYFRNNSRTANDPAFPSEILPIIHIGLGAAAVETSACRPDELIEAIESRRHPDYSLIPYESAGCIWAMYTQKFFPWALRMFTGLRLLRGKLPPWEQFLQHFSPDAQWALAHGYGRMMYFQDFHLGKTLNRIMGMETLNALAAAQGAAFAYSMLNHKDLHRVLEVGADLRSAPIRRGVRNGQLYTLAILDWHYPGFLNELELQSDRQAALIEDARALVAEGRPLGRLAMRATE